MRAHLLLLFSPVLLAVALAACGLKPVYSGGAAGAAAVMTRGVSVPAIPERSGFLLSEALRARLGAAGGAYRLQVELDDQLSGFGVRGDDSVSRERRTLRARWQLVETASGSVLIDETARADAGIDVVRSDYAVIAAENAALERLADDLAAQITARIARYADAAENAR